MWWWPYRKIFTSVPQVEQLRTRIFTSSGPAIGLGRVLEADVARCVEPDDLHDGSLLDGRSRIENTSSGSVGAAQRLRLLRVEQDLGELGQECRRARRHGRRWRRRPDDVPSPQSTPSGNRRTAEGVALHQRLAASVPCGIATPSPDVGGDRTLPLEHRLRRTPGSTAPISTRTAPALADRVVLAVRPGSPAGSPAGRAGRRPVQPRQIVATVLDRRSTTAVTAGSPMNTLERDDDGVRSDAAGPFGEPVVADHDVGVGGDRGRPGCARRSRRNGSSCLAQLAGEHDAAAHAGVAGDDDLA